MLRDFLAHADHYSRHQIEVNASRADAWPHVRHLDLTRSWVVRTLFTLRGMRRMRGQQNLTDLGFSLLEEDPPHRLILGVVGRFWRTDADIKRIPPSEFVEFDEPGWAKAAWGFELIELGPKWTRLTTETRIICTDEKSRRSFNRYWTLISPFSGLIRRAILRTIRNRAEAAGTAPI